MKQGLCNLLYRVTGP